MSTTNKTGYRTPEKVAKEFASSKWSKKPISLPDLIREDRLALLDRLEEMAYGDAPIFCDAAISKLRNELKKGLQKIQRQDK